MNVRSETFVKKRIQRIIVRAIYFTEASPEEAIVVG